MIKCWDIDVLSSCLLQKKKNTNNNNNNNNNNKKRKKKYHVYPKQSDTLPYVPQKFNKVIDLPIYLSKIPDESHSVPTLLTQRSALGPHCMLTSGKCSKCQLAGVLYNGVWTADAIRHI